MRRHYTFLRSRRLLLWGSTLGNNLETLNFYALHQNLVDFTTTQEDGWIDNPLSQALA